ncbi:MAG: hypothetical protein ACO3UU_15005, partial [Minisyncoccia bacterium]
ISDKTLDYSINKSASDLGISGLPVGQLVASNGSINIFDYDQAFNENNTSSIVQKYTDRHIQFKFYEVIVDVDGWDYWVPIKTLYSDSFPKADLINTNDRSICKFCSFSIIRLYRFFKLYI